MEQNKDTNNIEYYLSKNVFEQLIANLLSSNNEERKKSEYYLQTLINNDTKRVILLLSELLNYVENSSIRQLICTILNNLFSISKNLNSTKYLDMLENDLSDFQNMILSSFIKEQNDIVKSNIVDLISSICETLLDSKDTSWKDVIQYVIKGFKNLNNKDLNLESFIYLFTKIYALYNDEFKKEIYGIVSTLTNLIDPKDNTLDSIVNDKSISIRIKVKISECLANILYVTDKKTKKKIKESVLSFINITIEVVSLKNAGLLKKQIFCISELNASLPTTMSSVFPDIFILMGSISENNFYEREIKEQAFDCILTLVEKKKTLFLNDEEKMNVFIKALIKFALSFDNFINEEWYTPTNISYNDEENVEEEEIKGVISYIERMIDCIGFQNVMKFLSKIILALIGNSHSDFCNNLGINETHHKAWKFQYLGFTLLSVIISYVEEFGDLSNIIQPIIENLYNENSKIKFACLQCITEISSKFNPNFQNEYYSVILKILLTNGIFDNHLRIRLQTCETLQSFIEFCHKEEIFSNEKNTNLKEIIEILLNIFKSNETVPILREKIIHLLTELTEVVSEQIIPFGDTLLSTMLLFLENLIKISNSSDVMLKSTLEYISILGPKLGNVFNQYVPSIVNLISLQASIKSISDYYSIWEILIDVVIVNKMETLLVISNFMIEVLKNTPKFYAIHLNENKDKIQNENQNMIDIKNLISDNKSNKKVDINTSETSDFTVGLKLLNIILDKAGTYLYYQIPIIEELTINLVSFELNSEIRRESSCTLYEVANLIVKQNEGEIKTNKELQDFIVNKIKQYISILFENLVKEADYQTISTFLDNIGGLVEILKMPFLQDNEMLEFVTKIVQIFEKIGRFRSVIIEKSDQIQKEFQNTSFESDNDNEESELNDVDRELEDELNEIENILVAIADLFASIFKSHKESSLCLVNKLKNEVIPKYITNKSSSFEIKMAIFILNDMVEHLGEKLVPDIWKDILSITCTYCINEENDIKEAAFSGLSYIYTNSINFTEYDDVIYNTTKEGIKKLKNYEYPDDEDFKLAKNSIIICVSRIIIFLEEMKTNINDNFSLISYTKKWLDLWLLSGELFINNDTDEEDKEIYKKTQLIMSNYKYN